jgi:hypothetical protein
MAVGRFQVMATLQAARASVLGLPLESAYSWGLNRAIFYAAAKRGFKAGGAVSAGHGAGQRLEETYHLGDEMAYKSGEPGALRFTIGGKTQSREDFERQVEARFHGRFKDAWEEAIDYVERFDRATLLSGGLFFSAAYRPKRDEFAARWTEMGAREGAVRASQSARRPPSARRRSS